jgi:predicted nucleic acid-binding protein
LITHRADSDWIIDLLKERAGAVRLLQPLIEQGSLAIPLVVYAEVYEGILGDPGREERLADFNSLLRGVPVVPPDEQTAQVFAQLRVDLRARGELLGDHDIWIASTALQLNLILLTRDHHFDRVEALKRA